MSQMLDRAELRRAIALHEQAYGLFKWLNASMKRGQRALDGSLEALSFADAAAEWIRRWWSTLPTDHRPADADADAFAHLFASYLATSFRVVERSAVRACPGCWCCVHWIESKHLRARDPDRKARADAVELERSYLRGLAAATGVAPSPAALEALTGDRTLAVPLALATYATELIRRTRFASQGEGVLALWRTISRDAKGRRNPKFRLTADAALVAEATVRARLLAGHER